MRGLIKAIRYFGSQKELAKHIGVRQQAISNWLNERVHIPYVKVLQIVSATKGSVSFYELAPYQRELNGVIHDLMKMFSTTDSPVIPGLNVCDLSFENTDLSIKKLDKKIKQQGKKKMREYAKVSTRFWTEVVRSGMKKLEPEVIVISLYVQTCSHANMIGIYYLPIPYVCFDTGLTEEEVRHALTSLKEIDFCTYDEKTGYIWVHEMAFDQIATSLEIRDKRVKAVSGLVSSLPPLSFLPIFLDKYAEHFHLSTSTLYAPSKPLLSQEQKQEKKQKQEKEQKAKSGEPDVSFLDKIYEKNQVYQPDAVELEEDALAILLFLNQKANRNYRPVENNLGLIKERLLNGITPVQCRQVIAKKTREWGDNPRMSSYLRPITLFNAINFEQYLGELKVVCTEVEND